MIKSLRTSIGIAVPFFVLTFLVQFFAKLLPEHFLPNHIHIGLPFVFLEISDLYGNAIKKWHIGYLICDFLIFWIVILILTVLSRYYKKVSK